MELGKISYIRAMKQLNAAIPNAKNIDEGLQIGLDIILENIPFQYAIVWYLDRSGEKDVLRSTYWMGELNLTTTEISFDGNIVGRVVTNRSAEIYNDCKSGDVLKGLDFLSEIEVRNMVCVPIVDAYDPLGCVLLINKEDGTDITADEYNTLDIFGILLSMYCSENDAIYESMHKHNVLASLRDIHKEYKNGDVVTPVLKGVNVDIVEGEFLVLLGESGCGKSTLLNIIGGIDTATSGSYIFKGQDYSHPSEAALTKYRKENIGFIFQSYNLMPNMTALQNLKYIAELKRESMDPEEALRLVKLNDKGGNYPSQMSGGQQQRVSIARALVKRPQMILADEPTAALDYETSIGVLQALEERVAEGMTLVMVTHNEEIAKMANRVIRMKSGIISSIKINHHPAKATDRSW
jgi:ABC-type lipoprotein export system ATPase subunit